MRLESNQQGWSTEQIAQYRIQLDIAESPKENQIPEQGIEGQFLNHDNLDSHTTAIGVNDFEKGVLSDTKLTSYPSFFQDKTQTIHSGR